jgi:hypothetical protein
MRSYSEVQEDRINLLKHALERKIGSDPANKHYDSVAPAPVTVTPTDNEQRVITRTDAEQVAGTNTGTGSAQNLSPALEGEGMYL